MASEGKSLLTKEGKKEKEKILCDWHLPSSNWVALKSWRCVPGWKAGTPTPGKQASPRAFSQPQGLPWETTRLARGAEKLEPLPCSAHAAWPLEEGTISDLNTGAVWVSCGPQSIGPGQGPTAWALSR